ncbi:MAG: septum site-determining protein MinC [Caldimonas sp.]
MPVVSSSTSIPSFELKNATLTLLALVLRTTDLDRLAYAFEERFGPTPALFDHDPIVLDLSQVAANDEADAGIDFEALTALLRARRMLAVGVEGGSPAQMAAALAAGLGETSTLGVVPRIDPMDAKAAAAASPEALDAMDAADPKARAAAAPASRYPTLVIDRPLRSGQQVYARGADLVMLAAVNFGAEVIADGHIHVYAPLRGRAIAGARGDSAARIFSTCMEPQLVAIAGTYRTLEEALPADVLGKPAQVWLDGDALVVEALPT